MHETGTSGTAAVVALRNVGRNRSGALLRRLGGSGLLALRRARSLPRALIEAVFETDDTDLLRALAGNPGLDHDTLLRVARLGRPALARTLYRPTNPERHAVVLRRAVLAAADPADPDWRTPHGFVPWLLTQHHERLLEPALWAPFGELVAHALLELGPDLPPAVVAERHRALRSLLDESTFARFRRAAGDLDHGDLLDRLDDPAAAEGHQPSSATHLLLLRVRRAKGPVPVPPDWSVAREEHLRKPFPSSVTAVLARWADCPDEIVRDGGRSARPTLRARAFRLPTTAPTGPGRNSDHDLDHDEWEWTPLLRRGLRRGRFSASALLTEAGPAVAVLLALPDEDPAVHAAVRALLAPLGTDADAWSTVLAELPRFPGTPAALVATALAGLAPNRARPRPSGGDPARILLFRCASSAQQHALVSLLDPPALRPLLAAAPPDRALRERLRAVHGPAANLILAGVAEQPSETVAELLDLDDPAVNALLFRRAHLDDAAVTRLLSGVDRAGRPGTVPLASSLLGCLERDEGPNSRLAVDVAPASDDPRVARIVLRRRALYTDAGRLRALLDRWRNAGPDGVRTLIDEATRHGLEDSRNPFPAETVKLVRAALDDVDGPALLHARLAEVTTPAAIVTALRGPAHAAGVVLAECGPPPWDTLIETLTRDTWPDEVRDAVVAHPECPRELLLARLACPPEHPHHVGAWVRAALERGALTVEDIVRTCRPARVAFDLLAGSAIIEAPAARRPALDPWRLPDELRPHRLRARLGTTPDAWTVAVRLLPDFSGTLIELLDTATAMAAPVDRAKPADRTRLSRGV
ncbi:hypothetical protein B4N89_39490 [Embleya scabrispora]|uniref:Uncharacterized protein n=1 Tax=Embleya scabrispora TaxID=159449 RepID=A0A1T3NMX3_9ACTN|nr:hypothetical protein [Embleya scabrispora]OPC78263.1 hypothetical protein B4N89_39490 [Embleya scabrispora]